MTEDAFLTGFSSLLALWPHRAPDKATVKQLGALYLDACGDLSDAAWTAACHAAISTSKHFPMPVELREMADDWAEKAAHERTARLNAARIREADAYGRWLLETGQVSAEMAKERAVAIDGLTTQLRQPPAPDDATTAIPESWWTPPKRLGQGRRDE